MAVLVVAMSACAQESDEEEIQAVVRGYLEAVADGDYDRACGHLSEAVKRDMTRFAEENLPEMESPDCAQMLESFLAGADREALTTRLRAAAEKDIAVTVEGERASV